MILSARPRVSVIIPCHNYGRYLGEALNSVRTQTFRDLEIIVVDDGSTDETPEVIAGFADSRLRHRRTMNRGVSAARNAGLDMARGEFIAFLDADDRWHPDKLERQVALMDAEPSLALVFSDLQRFSDDGLPGETQFEQVPELKSLPMRSAGRTGGMVIEEDAFTALGPLDQLPAWIQTDLFRAERVRDLRFPEEMRLAEDLHYIMRAYRRGGAGFVPEPLVDVRRHADNSYQRHAEMLKPVLQALYLLRSEALSPAHRQALKIRLGRAWLALGYQYFWDGRPALAAATYARAATYPGQRVNALLHVAASPLAPLFRAVRRDG